MNLSPRWAVLLTETGFEAAHWSTIGVKHASDREIMLFAAANDYAVITHDLDFGAILAVSNGRKPSVIQVRSEDVSPEIIGKQVIAALRQMVDEIERGALLTIDPKRTRIRVLPLGLND